MTLTLRACHAWGNPGICEEKTAGRGFEWPVTSELTSALDESVAAHLCPPTAIGWKARANHLPSCASALVKAPTRQLDKCLRRCHSTALLQVFQAKMLASEQADLNAASLRDLRSVTDLPCAPLKPLTKPLGVCCPACSVRAPPLAHDGRDVRGGQSSLPQRSGFVRQAVWTSSGGLCGKLHGGSEVISRDATLPAETHQFFCYLQMPQTCADSADSQTNSSHPEGLEG